MKHDVKNVQNGDIVDREDQSPIWLEPQPDSAVKLLGDSTLEYVKLRSHGRVGDVVRFCMLGLGGKPPKTAKEP